MTDKPTGEELCAVWSEDVPEDYDIIHLEDAEETGRDDHGYSYTRYFHRKSDDTYWSVDGVNQSEGDYDTLRDDPKYITVTQVRPVQKTITTYEVVRT